MAKCVVNRDANGNIVSVEVVKNEIASTEVFNDAIEKNNGNDLDKAPNGEDSILYNDFISMGLTPVEAREKVSAVYSEAFINWFGDWINNPEEASKVVDENGQPKMLWSGQTEKLETFNAYTNRTEDDRIDNDAFFPVNKLVAMSYSTGGSLDFTAMSPNMIEKFSNFLGSVEGVYLNIKNPRIVEDNNGLSITPLIKESEDVDGFYGATNNKANENTWAILDNDQVRYTSDTSFTQTPLKNGVDELFEENTALQSIGTKAQYNNYLDTVFPESKMKDIVYHFTNDTFDNFERNSENHKGHKTATEGFHFVEHWGREGYKLIFGKNTKTVILNLKNPVYTDYNSEDDNHLSQKLEFLSQSNKEEFEKEGYDSGIIEREGDEEYIAFEPEQIHVLGGKNDITGFKNYVRENDTTEYVTIPSELYDQLKQQPFITPEQALEIYKNIYSEDMNYWKNEDLNCE